MSADTFSCVPARFEAGNTVSWTTSFGCYPTDDWALIFVLSQAGAKKYQVSATVSEGKFVVTIPASATANFPGGVYEWAEYVTSDAERETARTGTVIILPNLAVDQEPSFAQQQVELLQDALSRLAAGTNETVNINGQSFTKRNIETYQKQLTYWEARVIRERREQAALRGDDTSGRIVIQFAPRGCNGNFGPRFR